MTAPGTFMVQTDRSYELWVAFVGFTVVLIIIIIHVDDFAHNLN